MSFQEEMDIKTGVYKHYYEI